MLERTLVTPLDIYGILHKNEFKTYTGRREVYLLSFTDRLHRVSAVPVFAIRNIVVRRIRCRDPGTFRNTKKGRP